MAPIQKRMRQDDDGDSAAGTSVRFSDAHRKKARISAHQHTAHDRHSSVSSSDEDDAEISREAISAGTFQPATQYEELRDNDWKELETQDLDDHLATQSFIKAKQAATNRVGDNVAAENAIIQEITCINFMCHERMHVKLGPLINFVVGQNGSGKSAVLTAIVMCLGGKAAATNRGSSLKSLIKEGTDSALLIIKLKNGGSDAYQPDLYGESVIVERHFTRQGTSGYRLKSASGRLISTKKGDVDDLLEYYQLQVDNPMNVLNQDAAKTFINSSTPKQKYQFFFEGVQLQQLDNDYKLVLDYCNQMNDKLLEYSDTIRELKKTMDLANEKVQISKQHTQLRAAQLDLANQQAWAQVRVVEKDLDDAKHEVLKAQARIDKAEADAEYQAGLFDQLNQKRDDKQETVNKLTDEAESFVDRLAKLKEEHDQLKKQVKEAQAEERHIQSQWSAAKAKVVSYNEEIAKEERLLEDVNGGAPTRLREKIHKAEKGVLDAEKALIDHDKERPSLDQEHQASVQEVLKATGPIKKQEELVKEATQQLYALKNDQSNGMQGYDSKIFDLLKQIDRDSGFREKPIGPIGRHIKLLRPEWSPVVEAVLSDVLSNFIVTSRDDQVRLSSMISRLRLNRECSVIIGNHRPLNTLNEPDPQYDTILRVLEIDNDLVKKQLVITKAIEQCLLIRNLDQANMAMFNGQQPRNTKVCFAENNREYARQLSNSGGGKENTGLRIATNRLPRMKTDIDVQLKNQQSNLDFHRSTKKELDNKLHELQQSQKKSKEALDKHDRFRKTLKAQHQKSQDLVESLTSELDEIAVTDGKIDSIKSDLAEAMHDVQIYSDSLGDQLVQRKKINDEANKVFASLQAASEEERAHAKSLESERKKLTNIEASRNAAVVGKNSAIAAIAEQRESKVQAEAIVEVRARTVNEFIEGAQGVCADRVFVPENETPESISIKLDTLTEQLKRYRRELGGDHDELNNILIAAEADYQAKSAEYQSMNDLLDVLKNSFMNRLELFRKFRSRISARSRINFAYLLLERGFRGKLAIDHKQKLLEVTIEPDGAVAKGKGRQTKTLSGGEKSFSSICLLLSLWEAMGAPLRCLDEYDVFMDDVNRDVSSKMIIGAARRSVGRQYILITPKGIGNALAKESPDVQVNKLGDPRANRIENYMDQAE